MKNLVYNKLARWNIFYFINSISILVVLTYCYHDYYCSSYHYYRYYCHYYFYYYHHYYYLFIVIIVIIIFVFSIINVIHFILFHFIFLLVILLIFVCVFMWHVCVSSSKFFFLVNDLHFILALLIHIKNHFFSFVITVYMIIVIITIILIFSTQLVIGGNSPNEFEQHGLPLLTDYLE